MPDLLDALDTEPREGTEGPLWQSVAHRLRMAIIAGVHPIGALLPTELELSAQFGVSRQTMRQAIGALRREGLLEARKGVGTRVVAREPSRPYVHAIADLMELVPYAREHQFHVHRTERVALRGRRATEFGVRPGTPWLRLTGVREGVPGGAPLGLMEVWVDGRFAGGALTAAAERRPIYTAIEAAGTPIEEVRQEISARPLTDAEAADLGEAAGQTALLLTRRYFMAGGRLVEHASTIHPASRFRYAIALRRG